MLKVKREVNENVNAEIDFDNFSISLISHFPKLSLKLNELKVIGTFTNGMEHIDLDAAKNSGVQVFNSPYGNTRSVVELVIGEIIILETRSEIFLVVRIKVALINIFRL